MNIQQQIIYLGRNIPGEKIHRMGQGFSHMLQMMTSEFIKSIEKNEFPQENEMSSRNNVSTQFNDRSNAGLIINGKDDTIRNLKKFSKSILPKVKQFSNSKSKQNKNNDSLPVSDDDHYYLDDINYENELKRKKNSPKILKITKLEKTNFGKKSIKDLYGNVMTMTEKNNQIESNINKLGRNTLFLKYEKNTYDNSNINKLFK
jgi:hypothetical protein